MTAQPTINSIVHARPAPLQVLIIGGGIGGLTLAQGLKKSGVSVAVYERDRTTTDRVQGYRVHINPAGSLALHECLPPQLFEAFARTCGKHAHGLRFVTERMQVLLSFDNLNAGHLNEGAAQHRSVSRITLRQVLLSGLGDVVHFGKMFVRYEELPPAGSLRTSPTAPLPKAICWSPLMVAARACAGSFCPMPKGSIPAMSALPAKSSSMATIARALRPNCATA